MSRRNGASSIPVDPEFYRGILSPSQFAAIVDWTAVRNGHFAKALGKRGTLCSLGRRIRDLRTLEIAPPPPVPNAPVWQQNDPPFDEPMQFIDVDAEEPTPPATATSPDVIQSPPATATSPQVVVQSPQVQINAIVRTPQQVASTSADQVFNAASSYMQKIGDAASSFMLSMSLATTEFMSNMPSAAAPSATVSEPAPSCSICHDAFRNPYMGRCSHVFCEDCLMHPAMRTQVITEQGNIRALKVRICPQCRREGISFYKMLE